MNYFSELIIIHPADRVEKQRRTANALKLRLKNSISHYVYAHNITNATVIPDTLTLITVGLES